MALSYSAIGQRPTGCPQPALVFSKLIGPIEASDFFPTTCCQGRVKGGFRSLVSPAFARIDPNWRHPPCMEFGALALNLKYRTMPRQRTGAGGRKRPSR